MLTDTQNLIPDAAVLAVLLAVADAVLARAKKAKNRKASLRAQMVQALQAWLAAPTVTGEAQAQVAEHVHWALAQQHAPQ